MLKKTICSLLFVLSLNCAEKEEKKSKIPLFSALSTEPEVIASSGLDDICGVFLKTGNAINLQEKYDKILTNYIKLRILFDKVKNVPEAVTYFNGLTDKIYTKYQEYKKENPMLATANTKEEFLKIIDSAIVQIKELVLNF